MAETLSSPQLDTLTRAFDAGHGRPRSFKLTPVGDGTAVMQAIDTSAGETVSLLIGRSGDIRSARREPVSDSQPLPAPGLDIRLNPKPSHRRG
jgi:hypothetical protein